jgi:hypothetical protein
MAIHGSATTWRAAPTNCVLPLRITADCNAMYGEMVLSSERGRLVIRWQTAWVVDLEHWHYDTFLVRWRDPVMRTSYVTFRLSPEGSVAALEVEVEGEEPLSFDAAAPVAN